MRSTLASAFSGLSSGLSSRLSSRLFGLALTRASLLGVAAAFTLACSDPTPASRDLGSGDPDLPAGTDLAASTTQPVVRSLDITTGSTTGGTTVVITGQNFRADSRAFFGGLPATVSGVTADGTSLTVRVPPSLGRPGAVDVAVTNPDNQSGTLPAAFKYFLSSVVFANATAAPTVNVLANAGPRALIAADLDADGKVDLITANAGANNVSILSGRGDGTFDVLNRDVSPSAMPLTGRGPLALVAVDVTTDQRLDLITSNSATNNLSVFTQPQGGGALGQPVLISTSISVAPQGLGAADLDGDGDTDLVVGNAGGGSVSVLLNNGSGLGYTTAAGTPLAVGFNPVGLTVADLNKDRRPDLVVTNGTGAGNTVRVLLNTTAGYVLQAPITVGTTPSAVVAADLDRDGNLDLAVTNSGSASVTLLKGSGTGAFTVLGSPIVVGATPLALVAADLNLDDKLDLVVPNSGANPGTLHVLLGNGDGTFTPTATSPVIIGREAFAVAVADSQAD